jgi:hypothetical protein
MPEMMTEDEADDLVGMVRDAHRALEEAARKINNVFGATIWKVGYGMGSSCELDLDRERVFHLLNMAGRELYRLDRCLENKQAEFEKATNLKMRREAALSDPQDADDVL